MLCCHPALRRSLLDRGVMRAIKKPQRTTPNHEIREWCEEITKTMEEEVSFHTNSTSVEDEEKLNRIAPLESKIEWSTWGSKLNMIFSPIFSHIPTISGQQLITNMDESLEVKLDHGISNPSLLNRYKDSLLYCVVEKPCHGRISTLTTTGNEFTYTPHVGYVGSDFFTYKLQLASLSTSAVTISINIVDTPDLGDKELGEAADFVEGKDVNYGSDDGNDREQNKKPRSVRKGKVELTKSASSTLQDGSSGVGASDKKIEDLFAISGAAGAHGLKDRFNNPEANLGMKSRGSFGSRIRDISPMRMRSNSSSGYQELPTFQGNKRQGATSSSKNRVG